MAGTIYLPICEGIFGTIGSLDVDESHIYEICDVPIDTLVSDSTKKISDDEDFGAFETME